ncbi:hypothetical protein H105_07933 [Trichophyton soudanense CBS 452.61]|uniref:Uncharacterized protein n=1 Tax=Trichophyton soudanense CBS 452.61 TaxID=1215331 RepID=A0A022XG63_TRISD|nr:hypothetical protein H105_07933 [Trichophyton soudanense CBS 452.61]EZG02204.1 hypothetical protein H106_07773 [Trichophyton rubrum CBS 735.88]
MGTAGMERKPLQKSASEKILPLAVWAHSAKFRVTHELSWETCIDDEMEVKLANILSQPGIKEKMANELARHFIIRVSGPISAYFGTSQGPAYVYPLRIHDQKSPTIAGIPLRVGECIQICRPTFVVTAGVDCLIILTVNAEAV